MSFKVELDQVVTVMAMVARCRRDDAGLTREVTTLLQAQRGDLARH
jgi:hypothetical protein